MAELRLESVTVDADGDVVLRDVSFAADDGAFVAIVGPSGCGKTSLLRAISGLAVVRSGRVVVGGRDITSLPPARRDMAMVFQEPALLTHRSIRGNVAFPLEVRHEHTAEIARRVDAEIGALHLESLLGRKPTELSRGEERLVQIARAMVRVPTVLLLDEPFSHLDPPLRSALRAEIGMLQSGYGLTTVLATNDPADAIGLASQLVVMADGGIVQVGTPADVRRSPVTLDAARVTDDMSTLRAVVDADADGFWLLGTGLRHRMWATALAPHVGQQVLVGLRVDDLTPVEHGTLAAEVRTIVPGDPATAICAVGTDVLSAPRRPSTAVGDTLQLRIDHAVVFDPSTGLAIC